jgi:nucleotidyltransferase substrate binding protein (TIGR01987 family)
METDIMAHDIRWKQRFENFERAFLLLREALEIPLDSLSDLAKEGIVQRFEYTFELAWKTLKDYLEYGGVTLDQSTPRAVIKQAFAANILPEGQSWITMLEQRNLMAHTYDKDNFQRAIQDISQNHFIALKTLYELLKVQASS